MKEQAEVAGGSAVDHGVEVAFAGEVLEQIRRHARSSMSAEICGVLIGTAAEGKTRVNARIAGEGADQGGAHVTFTQDTWEHIFKIKDAKYPSESIVGWYHSHPGFGIFLSDYDLFIHENFFSAPHQVAWVFDPHSDEDGCFGWVEKKVQPLSHFSVVGNHQPPGAEQMAREEASRKAQDAAMPKARRPTPVMERRPSRWRRVAAMTVFIFLGFAAGVVFPRVLPEHAKALGSLLERYLGENKIQTPATPGMAPPVKH